jgi:hypothetical protein
MTRMVYGGRLTRRECKRPRVDLIHLLRNAGIRHPFLYLQRTDEDHHRLIFLSTKWPYQQSQREVNWSYWTRDLSLILMDVEVA